MCIHTASAAAQASLHDGKADINRIQAVMAHRFPCLYNIAA